MSFKFDRRQRVAVPAALGIQGIITSRRDFIGRENSYLLEWKDAAGNDAAVWFDESAIVAANDPITVEIDDSNLIGRAAVFARARVKKPRDIARRTAARKRKR